MKSAVTVLAFVALAVSTPLEAQSAKLHRGAKVFVASMPDDFDTYVKSALEKKQVPVQVGASRDEAEFEIKGTSESQKAGAAKKIFMGSWHSDEQPSIDVECPGKIQA